MPPSGIEEAVVQSGEPKRAQKKTLEVRVVFEPSRIAPICMAQAYERVVPIARRGIATGQQGGRRAGGSEAERQQCRSGAPR